MANKLLRAYAGGQRLIDKKFSEIFPSFILNGVMDKLKFTFLTGQRQHDEIYYEDANVKSWFRQVYTRSDNYVILSAEDINCNRNADALKAINNKLRVMDHAKTEFFDNVSHEFRTPLALILGPLRDIMKDPNDLSSAVIEKLQMVVRNVTRLQKLSNNLLDYSRVEADRLDALFQPTDITEFTSDIASSFRSVIESAGLRFVVRRDRVGEPVYLNREMWEKIVLNLISNAFKFTHNGKIELRIKSKKHAVQLIVTDTGVGIASKDLSRIFDRFVRLNNDARTYGGTGIGLALVKELVHIHKGNIRVKSKEGVGSTFIVTLLKGKAHLARTQVLSVVEDIFERNSSDAFAEEASQWLPENDVAQSSNA
jgi:signal transduction histidine kinase